MVEIIKKHIEDRKSVNTELKKIMRYCDDSPINLKFLNKKWGYRMGELYLQVKNYSLDTVNVWKNKVMAKAFMFSKKKDKNEQVVIGLPYANIKNNKKESLWD